MLLTTESDDRTAKVWEAGSGKELLTLVGHSNFVYGVAFSLDGKRLATAGFGTAKVWDTDTGKNLLTLDGQAAAFKPVPAELDQLPLNLRSVEA